MAIGQGRPVRIDALAVAAVLSGALLQLLAPVLLPPAAAWTLAFFLAAVALFVWRAKVRGRGLGLFAMLLAGVALVALRGHAALGERLPAAYADSEAVLQGRIVGLPRQDGEGARAKLEVERIIDASPGLADALRGRRIDLRWYRGQPGWKAGERWQLRVRVAPPGGMRNPGGDDPARRALVEGVAALATVRPDGQAARLGAGTGLDAWREGRSARIVELLGVDRSRFVRALALGDTRGLSEADWATLRRFGLTHLIAISGFHVGLVAGLGVLAVWLGWWLLPALCRTLPRAQAGPLAALAVAVVYAGVAGFSVPTLRTVAMIGVLALLRLARVRTASAQGLALAALALAAVDPFVLLAPGFWLSCAGVAWLLWCLPGQASALSPRTFLTAQWVASLGLLPIAAALFLEAPLLGPLANLIAIPWISLVVVPLSLLGLLLSLAWGAGASAAWTLAEQAMALLWALLAAVPEAWASTRSLPASGPLALALALLGVAWLLAPRGLPWRPAGALLLLPLLWPAPSRPPLGEAELWVFQVPRGDSVLLRTPRHDLLLDSGGERGPVLPALQALGVRELGLQVETRGNAGRSGGALAIAHALKPNERWSATASATASGRACGPGQRWQGDGLRLAALHPHSEFPTGSVDAACVLRLDGPLGALWFSGDAGRWIASRAVDWHQGAAPPAAVIGAPAALAHWQTALGAGTAVATRAPGAGLRRDGPMPPHHVDSGGALRVRWHRDGVEVARWRDLRRRWWDGPEA